MKLYFIFTISLLTLFILYYFIIYQISNDPEKFVTIPSPDDNSKIKDLISEVKLLISKDCTYNQPLYNDICYCNSLAGIYMVESVSDKKIKLHKRTLYVPEIRYLPIETIEKIINE
jgi:hypothetical protein